MNYNDNLMHAIKAAIKAGEIILSHYQKNYDITIKSDYSPVTIADQQSQAIIIQILKESNLPIISEELENKDYNARKNWNLCWIVDPLDGTKEFINKNGEFTVNIALIENQEPVIGVIYSPVSGDLYFATKELGSYKAKVHNHLIDEKSVELLPISITKHPLKIAISRSHTNEQTQAFINALKIEHPELETIVAGSSIKMCKVAEGIAHLYPRFGRTMEWDTAAGHAILKYAKANIFDINTLQEIKYNKENLENPYFIAIQNHIEL